MSFLTTFLGHLSIKDFVDISIVAVLIYQLLLIVRGTKAVQMMVGLGVLFILFWLGVTFKLYSLNWVLAHFFDSFFIIVIVLFQDQFRSALASFGTQQRNIFSLFKSSNDELAIDEIIEACSALSAEKIGAIIVIERNNGLLNYINTGSRIDSRIHSDLIYSIFESSSSLHDGAIIIRRGKIASAGSFLPLSKNFDIERHLGTRHRAALGLSELTDAIVVVVSEETGKINLCIEGIFYNCRTDKDLGQYLRHLWSNEKLDHSLKPIRTKDIVR
jgi:diadenylate cyclase